jgi:hypothetical protein
MMATISEEAVSRSTNNYRLYGRLMATFNKTQQTIINWFEARDVRLITPDAVRIISEETGLSKDEVISETVEQEM